MCCCSMGFSIEHIVIVSLPMFIIPLFADLSTVLCLGQKGKVKENRKGRLFLTLLAGAVGGEIPAKMLVIGDSVNFVGREWLKLAGENFCQKCVRFL